MLYNYCNLNLQISPSISTIRAETHQDTLYVMVI